MPINHDAASDEYGEPVERSWDSKDSLLYSVGVGAGSVDPTGLELEFTTENSKEVTQRALPTLGVILGFGARHAQPRFVQPGDARARRAGHRAAP